MKKLLIDNLLIEIENSIGHQKTPQMRANDIYRLLEIEKANIKDIDSLIVKNEELIIELDIALKLLSDYIENYEFNLRPDSESDFDKFEMIKNSLSKAIDKFNSDTPFFME